MSSAACASVRTARPALKPVFSFEEFHLLTDFCPRFRIPLSARSPGPSATTAPDGGKTAIILVFPPENLPTTFSRPERRVVRSMAMPLQCGWCWPEPRMDCALRHPCRLAIDGGYEDRRMDGNGVNQFGIERRRAPRLQAGEGPQLSLDSAIPVQVLDISLSGVLLASKAELCVGDRAEFRASVGARSLK